MTEPTVLLTKEPAAARRALRTMWTIRLFEEAVDDLFARGLMHGTMHLSIGQEAVAAGACMAIRPDDFITSTHRGHGHCIAKGADVERMMAELLGRENGYCHGRGGSMHIADVATGNLGANGIVAGGIPIAAGAGLAQRLRGTTSVVVSFFGDGAVNEGAFHEGMNLAAIWQLPVVFLCENNFYGMSMSTARAVSIDQLSARAAGYGMPGHTIDGNDLQAVYDCVAAAAERARQGAGPSLIEAQTYRWKGHSKSDKNLYRTRDEIEDWKKKDPIERFRAEVTGLGTLTEAEAEAEREAATDTVRAAIRAAHGSPEAPVSREALLAAVYAQ
jgi:TPP-dependent pyruvate/acetoin dehydrogenase alpha subunit